MYSLIAIAMVGVARSQNHKKPVQPGLCSIAIAEFDGSFGVTGFTSVSQDGDVVINIDVLDLNASSVCDDNGDSGFKYHIHEFWNHMDFTSQFGETQCGSALTGTCFVNIDIQYWVLLHIKTQNRRSL